MTRYSKKYLFFPIRYFMQKQKLIRVKMNLESKNNMTLKLILPDAYQSVFPFDICILVFNSIKSSNLQLKSSTDWCLVTEIQKPKGWINTLHQYNLFFLTKFLQQPDYFIKRLFYEWVSGKQWPLLLLICRAFLKERIVFVCNLMLSLLSIY